MLRESDWRRLAKIPAEKRGMARFARAEVERHRSDPCQLKQCLWELQLA